MERSEPAVRAGSALTPARILIVPDKFKGTLASLEACAAIARGWKSMRAGDQLELLPMSDGGDGFGEVMARLLKAQSRIVKTLDAAHRPITAQWWWVPGQKLAIMEAARVVGLAMLPKRKYDPFQLDTFGLGPLVQSAIKRGAKQCLIGIGGSATNDAGFGLARALGWKFLDRNGVELEQWWQLHRLARATPPRNACKPEIHVAADVLNPLLGPRGCSRVYGPQKGLKTEAVVFAEKCLRRLGLILKQQSLAAHVTTPGAGAAGGLGFGLMTFVGAQLHSGFNVFASAAQVEMRICKSDLVITGEGAVDRQTFMGKGVGQIALLCKQHKIPCIALAGIVEESRQASKMFWQAHSLTGISSLDQAKKHPKRQLERLSAKAARDVAIIQ